MKERERKGIAFGFEVLIIWLIFLSGLTCYLTYDKIKVEKQRAVNTVILPPMLEGVEIYEYDE